MDLKKAIGHKKAIGPAASRRRAESIVKIYQSIFIPIIYQYVICVYEFHIVGEKAYFTEN